jgi:hypothetical protein
MKFDASNLGAHADQAVQLLVSWRSAAPPYFRWEDGDMPPTDLNIARIRAKYYGALYMKLRPFLQFAIERTEWPPSHKSGHYSQYGSPTAIGDTPTSASRNIYMVDLSPDQRKIIEVSCKCIYAAIQSTIAFDRIGAVEDSAYDENFVSTRTKRLVLTNIFGTLHAQFGNMLVLAAVYRSKLYHHLPETLLTRKKLNALFKRTIGVIEEVAPNSPTLRVDLDILRNVYNLLGLEQHRS